MKKEQIKIFIKTHERIVFRQISSQEIEIVCAECQDETIFIAPERAAVLAGMKMSEIYRHIEGRSVHFVETASGKILICPTSLAKKQSDFPH